MLEAIAASIEIVTFTAKLGKWVIDSSKSWDLSPKEGEVNDTLSFSIDYHLLSNDIGIWSKVRLGRETLREDNRLMHNRRRLLETYPGSNSNTLIDNRIIQIPYEVIIADIDKAQFNVSSKKYGVDAEILSLNSKMREAMTEHSRTQNQQFHNANLVRAAIWNHEESKLIVQKVEYFDNLSTNFIADLDIERMVGKKLTSVLGKSTNTLRQFDLALSDAPGKLTPLHLSSLANSIGVAGIALTADNRLILTQRPRTVSTYSGKIGVSSSGYLTWSDLENYSGTNLNDLFQSCLKREINEELSLDVSSEVDDFVPLGFYREMYRSGMPQAFYFFRTSLTSDEVAQRVKDAGRFHECVGLFFVPVNKQVLTSRIASIIMPEKLGDLVVSLEAQGVLLALAKYGEDIL